MYRDMPPERRDKYLDMIERSGRQSVAIINELLLLASIRKQTEVPVTQLDMSEVVSSAMERLQANIDQSSARISIPGRWPAAQGHPPWVEEVWVNYISNALKYGGKPPLIELGAQTQQDGKIRFYVKDNGLGLKAEETRRLFTEFARLDHSQAEGHGLGLSIVKRIVARLNGEVGVESTPGTGSIFWFTLPPPEAQSATQSA
jgi:signal transduction histidine kinase